MRKINYQALRDAAEKATQGEWVAFISPGKYGTYAVHTPGDNHHGDIVDWPGFDEQKNAENNARYIAAFNPEVVQALLDELERNQQYIKRRDQENEEIALTVGKLRVELEETKSKLNEQREYYEGVISDGSKRIAELEKSEEQLINECDHAESALADMYFAATGNRPEWSNWFGFSDAVDAVVDRIADLEAKQPSPVVPDNASGSLAYAYKELTPEIMRGHIAVFERYGIAPNDSSTTIQALRIALDGIERSDAILHGSEPVSQASKLPPMSSNEVNDAAWKLHNMLTEHGPLNGCQFNNLKECFYEALKVAMRNYPVIPDSWISCSERMPDTKTAVLVAVEFDRKGDWRMKWATYIPGHPDANDGWIIPGASWKPSHWMPLPEPPQEAK
ncbi:TPA: DUF551 domain-containing protein [Escherichia coli]|nr:DUF551 domain-containing protein [Escherichia coli]